MENATQALMIAARVILAAIILVVLIYFFRTLRLVPTSEDDAAKIEQARKFNLEYEVYDKKLMYGLDVISCLNKAKSHNEKYVEGSFLSGNIYGTREEFYIQVEFILRKELTESIDVYYVAKPAGGNTVIKETRYTTGGAKDKKAFRVANNGGVFKLPSKDYLGLILGLSDVTSRVEELETKPIITTKVIAGTYKLVKDISARRNGSISSCTAFYIR